MKLNNLTIRHLITILNRWGIVMFAGFTPALAFASGMTGLTLCGEDECSEDKKECGCGGCECEEDEE